MLIMQNIIILSANYRHTPIAIREKVVFTADKINFYLNSLKSKDGIEACAILSTCGRSEIYVTTKNTNIKELLINYLSITHNIKMHELEPCVDYFENKEAVKHICLVAAGLDSLALGEPQILGQLKDAYRLAKQAGTLDKLLEKLFQHSFSTAKKVRTDTSIGSSPISIAYYATKLSEKIFTDLTKQVVLLIGSGEIIELCAQYFNQKNVKSMIIANRTLENIQKISALYNAKAISLKEFPNFIHKADIVISSTAASVPIIGKGLIETALKLRRYRPIFMLDIAIPRDIEPEVAQLDDIFLYTVDDLQKAVAHNIDNRKKEKILAEKIIKAQNYKFSSWLEALPNERVIQSYRNNAYVIKNILVDNAFKKLQQGVDSKFIIEELANKLISKLLHKPFKNIKTNPQSILGHCQKCIPQSNDNIGIKNI